MRRTRIIRASWFVSAILGPLNTAALAVAIYMETNALAMAQTLVSLVSFVALIAAVNYVYIVIRSNLRRHAADSSSLRCVRIRVRSTP